MAGLMIAQLCKAKYDVTVLEQSKDIYSKHCTGGLSLGEWAINIFKTHIPNGELIKNAIFHKEIAIVSAFEGETKQSTIPLENYPVCTTTWDAVYRTLLSDIQYNSRTSEPMLLTNTKVTHAKYEDNVWKVSYTTGATYHVEQADILIAADGAHSTIRKATVTNAQPHFTGRLAWRGRVPGSIVIPQELKGVQEGLLVFVRMGGHYIILRVIFLSALEPPFLTISSYAVPNIEIADTSGKASMEWCWYYPYTEGASLDVENIAVSFVELDELFKDDLRVQRINETWKKHLQMTKDEVPPSIWTVLSSCDTPWVTKVTSFQEGLVDPCDQGSIEGSENSGDCRSVSLLGEKLFLIGEACAQLPPHIGASVDATAEQALAITDRLEGNIDSKTYLGWVKEVTARRHEDSEDTGEMGMYDHIKYQY